MIDGVSDCMYIYILGEFVFIIGKDCFERLKWNINIGLCVFNICCCLVLVFICLFIFVVFFYFKRFLIIVLFLILKVLYKIRYKRLE